MPYVDSEISDFSNEDLIDELRSRNCSRMDTADMIEELEENGYTVIPDDTMQILDVDTKEDIEKLYLDYMLTGPEFFDKQLKHFFNTYLNKTLR